MLSASYSNFEVPNTPGLPAGTSPDGNPWLPGTFDSANLNENQKEQNYYVGADLPEIRGRPEFAGFGLRPRAAVHFTPDPVGDLFFNGVASDVDRMLYSGGLQADGSYQLDDQHTMRAGAMVIWPNSSGPIRTRPCFRWMARATRPALRQTIR